MQKVIEFLNRYPSGYLATSENNIPHVRPWGFMFEDSGKYWFLTSKTKDVFKQMEQNPYIEFSSSSPDFFNFVRLSGKAEFSDDLEIKRRMFEHMPMLKTMHQTHENPGLAAFYVEHGKAMLYSMDKDKKEVFEF